MLATGAVQDAEDGRRGHFFQGGSPAQGVLGQDRRALGAFQPGLGHVGAHPARGHHEAVDPAPGQGHRQGLGEGVEAGLAGGVGGVLGLAAEGAAGADAHQPAAAGGGHGVGREVA